MLQELKKEVFDSRINKEKLTEEDFKKKIEELAKKTKSKIINMFFKKPEDFHK